MPGLIHKVRISVNGSPMELPKGVTISDLLSLLEIGNEPVAVEQNLEIVSKADYSKRVITEGDSFEIVHFVGGG